MCALHLPLVTIALKTGLTDSKDNELVLGSHTAVTEDRTDESTTTTSLRVGGIDNGLEEISKFKKLWISVISQPKEGVSPKNPAYPVLFRPLSVKRKGDYNGLVKMTGLRQSPTVICAAFS